ncbi:hypothetical protein PV702_28515 [Streptomyces sp. FL06-04B]|uniref:hypothetical protein n=1 Tax=unclassified Streptomyces TaxID=2593676 RepID=UPI0029AC4B2C|nr:MULTISPECIES: hypothetical protein [unclassified Streptomyces]MDX3610301.1 hypothetical protein [Streptomyces sp. FL06-04B]MDX3737123.1 hypothetical protein [Streptomyces sp. ID01-15D]
MGFLDRLIGPPSSGSAGSIGTTGQPTPTNTPPQDAEQAIRTTFRDRREAARRHYKKTGDSGPMWQAKADETDAINASRRNRRR